MRVSEKLAKLAELRAKATPGKWGFRGDWGWRCQDSGTFSVTDRDGCVLCGRTGWPERAAQSVANGDLIVASANTDFAALAAHVERLERDRAVLLAACQVVTKAAGNLSDAEITTRAWPNDASARGHMLVLARDTARAAIEAVGESV